MVTYKKVKLGLLEIKGVHKFWCPQPRLVDSGTLTGGDEWEGIIYSLSQIIAPFGPELENSF